MKKILIIEDTENVRENIIEILENEDYEVYAAENGKTGVEMALSIQPDLVLCDIMMPVMDGYETLKELRKHVVTATTPFIFLSAKNSPQDLRLGMELGADDYIPKPFTMEELVGGVGMRIKRSAEFIEKSEAKLNELTQNMGTPITEVINEPLKAVIGFSKMLMTEYPNMEKFEMAEFNQLIYRAGMKLRIVVGKSYLYQQLQSIQINDDELAKKKQEISKNAQSLAQDKVSELATENRRIDDISVSFEDADLHIPSEYFVAAIAEVTENAMLYSPKRTGISVVGKVEGDHYVVSVKDGGLGMTADQISKIGAYQKFQEDLEGKSGVGLGLINTKKIMDLFNGTFLIQSDFGVETEAKLSFLIAK